MVDIALLQVLLWEYFPMLAPFFKDGTGILTREQLPRRAPERSRPRIFWWSREQLPTRRRSIEEGMNSLDSFTPQPYNHGHPGLYFEPVYERLHVSFLFTPRPREMQFAIWVHPVVLSLFSRSLPALKESAGGGLLWDREAYNPQRVLSQFGMAQHVPTKSTPLSATEIDHRFLTCHLRSHAYPVHLLRPCESLVLVVTPSYMKYWAKLESSFREFRDAMKTSSTPPPVYTGDLTLLGKLVRKKFLVRLAFSYFTCLFFLLNSLWNLSGRSSLGGARLVLESCTL